MDPQTVIAKRIAHELRTGMLVNLGIGIPTLVATHLPEGTQVFFQSENGLIGTGAIPAEGMAHPMLTDARTQPRASLTITIRAGPKWTRTCTLAGGAPHRISVPTSTAHRNRASWRRSPSVRS